MGCDSSGFLAVQRPIGAVRAGEQPDPADAHQSRTNHHQPGAVTDRNGPGNSDRDNQRHSVLVALAQNSCGPQYAAAARNSGNFFDNLFGNNNADNNNPIPPVDLGVQSGTDRTVCVRSCDGFYFPISFATVPSRFPDDERTCKSLCPAADASLYTYRNPGEDMNQAVSISGQPYSSSPNAFHYRQEFSPSCSCKPSGETWSQALKGLDDKATAVQQGDIIVTEENAKKMAQPRGAAPAKKGNAPASAAAAPAPPPENASPAGASDKDNKSIRTVGPTFIPAR